MGLVLVFRIDEHMEAFLRLCIAYMIPQQMRLLMSNYPDSLIVPNVLSHPVRLTHRQADLPTSQGQLFLFDTAGLGRRNEP